MHIHFCTLQYQILAFGALSDHSWPGQPSLTKSATRSRMSFGWWLWVMIICGLLVSIRHIHVSNGGLLWWLVLVSWLSAFASFIIIIIALTYIFYGHMVYEYSFLVDLDILSSLIQSVFSFGHLQVIYRSF